MDFFTLVINVTYLSKLSKVCKTCCN